jgi:hypothetical protein
MHPDYKDIGDPTDKTIEELAELTVELNLIIKAICKAKRFGWLSRHPVTKATNSDVILELLKNIGSEVIDVMARCNELQKGIELMQIMQKAEPVYVKVAD